MYIPEHFRETDPEQISDLLQYAPLACIVASTLEGLVANHLPLIADASGTLVGHVALNNDMHRLITDQSEVLAIFRGSDAYISPNDYPTKQDHHKHVPTWNYQAVHVYGTVEFFHDEKTKRAAVGLLTQHSERLANCAKAWRMADAPRDYIDSMIGNIVAFKMTVTRVLAKSKLSQNREEQDYHGAIAGLMARDAHDVADAMRKRIRITDTT